MADITTPPHNDSPDLDDALRSIRAIGENETGTDDGDPAGHSDPAASAASPGPGSPDTEHTAAEGADA